MVAGFVTPGRGGKSKQPDNLGMSKSWEETGSRDKAGILKNVIKGKPEEDYKKGIKCCKDEKENKPIKMHTKIKSGQAASKRRGRFCNYAILFFKLSFYIFI